MNRPRNFKNRRVNTKMIASAAVIKVVIGLIAGWYYKESKVFSLIISAFTGG